MYLELADSEAVLTQSREGYTWIPYDDNTTDGAYVRNDVLTAALQSKGQPGLYGFFGSLWSTIKDVGQAAVGTILNQVNPQHQPVIIQSPPPPPANNNALLFGGLALAAILLLKK